MKLNRRSFLGTAAAVPLLAVSAMSTEPNYGDVYLYGRIQMTGPCLFKMRGLGAVHELLMDEFKGLRRDFVDFVLRQYDNDCWEPVIPNQLLVEPEARFLGNRQPRQRNRRRYFQPTGAGWMEQDGAIWSRIANRDAYEAIYFLYGRVQPDPGEWEVSRESLNRLMDDAFMKLYEQTVR